MNSRIFFPILFFVLVLSTAADAQVILQRRMPGRYGLYRRPSNEERLPKFEPSLTLSIGYGFPNLDKTYLPEYYNAFSGTASQTGPITGSLDYRFNRRMSVGVMVTHGTVSAPYYDYNGSSTPAFKARLDNWSIMVDLVRYIPVSSKISPYLRTAIGVNVWDQEFMDAQGNKISMTPVELPDLAYQVGLGAKFNLSKQAGLFVEAGYGKYILHGGLTFKL